MTGFDKFLFYAYNLLAFLFGTVKWLLLFLLFASLSNHTNGLAGLFTSVNSLVVALLVIFSHLEQRWFGDRLLRMKDK